MDNISDIQAVLDDTSEGCVACGDCLAVMADLPESCIDTIITDPPYGLKFMGKDWDHGIPGEHYWVEALRDGGRSTKTHNHHPTVKPLAVMEYLCRLTATPTGGIVLDPFCGSGSTGVACATTGRKFIGIDISAEYCEIARKRIEHAKGPLFA